MCKVAGTGYMCSRTAMIEITNHFRKQKQLLTNKSTAKAVTMEQWRGTDIYTCPLQKHTALPYAHITQHYPMNTGQIIIQIH